MVAPSTLFWVGAAAATAAAATGGVLVAREIKKRRQPLVLELDPGAIPPFEPVTPDLGSGPIAPPPPQPSRTTPPMEPIRLTKEGEGTLEALPDGGLLILDQPYEGRTRLLPTRYVFSLFELPRASGTFDVQVCVHLDFTFSDFTWARILKWEDGKRVRMFRDPRIRLYQNVSIRGEFYPSGRIDNVSQSPGWLYCGGILPFPTDQAFMYMWRSGQNSTLVSWGKFTWDGNLFEGGGSDKYRPRFQVFVEDGWLKLRIWVAPMPLLRNSGPGQAMLEARKAVYDYKYNASLRAG